MLEKVQTVCGAELLLSQSPASVITLKDKFKEKEREREYDPVAQIPERAGMLQWKEGTREILRRFYSYVCTFLCTVKIHVTGINCIQPTDI